MAHSTIKGATVPDAGDDLLAAWDAYDQTVGTIMPADSIAAARTTLASAEAAGVGPTAAHPWYFDMGGIIYRATGEKSKEGVFKLAPVNEVQTDTRSYAPSGGPWWSGTLTAGQYTGMITSLLPTAGYDRRIVVDANLFVRAISGGIYIRLSAQGRTRMARVDTGRDDASSYSLTVQSTILAGQAPVISLGLMGGSPGGGSAALTYQESYNELMVTAFPITMA